LNLGSKKYFFRRRPGLIKGGFLGMDGRIKSSYWAELYLDRLKIKVLGDLIKVYCIINYSFSYLGLGCGWLYDKFQ